MLEHSRGMENKRRRLNDSVRVRSWCPPTHHHEYDLRRWWRIVENIQHDRQRRTPALRNGKRRPPSSMNLAWLSYWWRRMERQAADDQKTKLEIKEQRIGAQRISCFLMSGKTSTSKTLQNGDEKQENELTCIELQSVQPGTHINDLSKLVKETTASKVKPDPKNKRKRLLQNSTILIFFS